MTQSSEECLRSTIRTQSTPARAYSDSNQIKYAAALFVGLAAIASISVGGLGLDKIGSTGNIAMMAAGGGVLAIDLLALYFNHVNSVEYIVKSAARKLNSDEYSSYYDHEMRQFVILLIVDNCFVQFYAPSSDVDYYTKHLKLVHFEDLVKRQRPTMDLRVQCGQLSEDGP